MSELVASGTVSDTKVKPSWARRLVQLLPARNDYEAMRRHPRRDVLAGVTVALVALPLALAFGVASGLGAGAGLVTAIVAGLLAAVFGGAIANCRDYRRSRCAGCWTHGWHHLARSGGCGLWPVHEVRSITRD